MDILCPKCGEPWGIDSLHDAVAENRYPDYDAAATAFRHIGCGVWGQRCTAVRDDRTAAASALYDLLGDDMDGAAAMLEDLGF